MLGKVTRLVGTVSNQEGDLCVCVVADGSRGDLRSEFLRDLMSPEEHFPLITNLIFILDTHSSYLRGIIGMVLKTWETCHMIAFLEDLQWHAAHGASSRGLVGNSVHMILVRF